MSAADIKIPIGCVPQAWYLSDDFRTLLVLPIYVILLDRSVLLGYSAILGTFCYSNLKLVQTLQEANIDYRILLKWQPHVYALMTDRLHDVYTNPLVRLSTYLLGITVGHLLYAYRNGCINQWPVSFTRFGMKTALSIGMAFFFGPQLIVSPILRPLLPRPDQINSDLVVLLIPLFKSAMEFSICVMILLLVTNSGGYAFIRDLLSSRTMKILSNISYAVFLTHVEIMYKLPAQQFDSNWWQLFIHAIFLIVISNLFSFVLHILFELPIQNITAHMFRRVFKRLTSNSS